MATARQLVRVAVPVPLADAFDYLWLGGSPAPQAGCRVRVPFGNRRLCGVVATVGTADARHADSLKAVEWLEPAPLLDGELLASLRWLARYLHAPLGEVLATALVLGDAGTLDAPDVREPMELEASSLDLAVRRAPTAAVG